MNSIVEEKLLSFKTLEQKIFQFSCEIAQEMKVFTIYEGWDMEKEIEQL